MARTPRERDHAKDIVNDLIECGALVQHGKKKGAKYGLPERRA